MASVYLDARTESPRFAGTRPRAKIGGDAAAAFRYLAELRDAYPLCFGPDAPHQKTWNNWAAAGETTIDVPSDLFFPLEEPTSELTESAFLIDRAESTRFAVVWSVAAPVDATREPVRRGEDFHGVFDRSGCVLVPRGTPTGTRLALVLEAVTTRQLLYSEICGASLEHHAVEYVVAGTGIVEIAVAAAPLRDPRLSVLTVPDLREARIDLARALKTCEPGTDLGNLLPGLEETYTQAQIDKVRDVLARDLIAPLRAGGDLDALDRVVERLPLSTHPASDTYDVAVTEEAQAALLFLLLEYVRERKQQLALTRALTRSTGEKLMYERDRYRLFAFDAQGDLGQSWASAARPDDAPECVVRLDRRALVQVSELSQGRRVVVGTFDAYVFPPEQKHELLLDAERRVGDLGDLSLPPLAAGQRVLRTSASSPEGWVTALRRPALDHETWEEHDDWTHLRAQPVRPPVGGTYLVVETVPVDEAFLTDPSGYLRNLLRLKSVDTRVIVLDVVRHVVTLSVVLERGPVDLGPLDRFAYAVPIRRLALPGETVRLAYRPVPADVGALLNPTSERVIEYTYSADAAVIVAARGTKPPRTEALQGLYTLSVTRGRRLVYSTQLVAVVRSVPDTVARALADQRIRQRKHAAREGRVLWDMNRFVNETLRHAEAGATLVDVVASARARVQELARALRDRSRTLLRRAPPSENELMKALLEVLHSVERKAGAVGDMLRRAGLNVYLPVTHRNFPTAVNALAAVSRNLDAEARAALQELYHVDVTDIERLLSPPEASSPYPTGAPDLFNVFEFQSGLVLSHLREDDAYTQLLEEWGGDLERAQVLQGVLELDRPRIAGALRREVRLNAPLGGHLVEPDPLVHPFRGWHHPPDYLTRPPAVREADLEAVIDCIHDAVLEARRSAHIVRLSDTPPLLSSRELWTISVMTHAKSVLYGETLLPPRAPPLAETQVLPAGASETREAVLRRVLAAPADAAPQGIRLVRADAGGFQLRGLMRVAAGFSARDPAAYAVAWWLAHLYEFRFLNDSPWAGEHEPLYDLYVRLRTLTRTSAWLEEGVGWLGRWHALALGKNYETRPDPFVARLAADLRKVMDETVPATTWRSVPYWVAVGCSDQSPEVAGHAALRLLLVLVRWYAANVLVYVDGTRHDRYAVTRAHQLSRTPTYGLREGAGDWLLLNHWLDPRQPTLLFYHDGAHLHPLVAPTDAVKPLDHSIVFATASRSARYDPLPDVDRRFPRRPWPDTDGRLAERLATATTHYLASPWLSRLVVADFPPAASLLERFEQALFFLNASLFQGLWTWRLGLAPVAPEGAPVLVNHAAPHFVDWEDRRSVFRPYSRDYLVKVLGETPGPDAGDDAVVDYRRLQRQHAFHRTLWKQKVLPELEGESLTNRTSARAALLAERLLRAVVGAAWDATSSEPPSAAPFGTLRAVDQCVRIVADPEAVRLETDRTVNIAHYTKAIYAEHGHKPFDDAPHPRLLFLVHSYPEDLIVRNHAPWTPPMELPVHIQSTGSPRQYRRTGFRLRGLLTHQGHLLQVHPAFRTSLVRDELMWIARLGAQDVRGPFAYDDLHVYLRSAVDGIGLPLAAVYEYAVSGEWQSGDLPDEAADDSVSLCVPAATEPEEDVPPLDRHPAHKLYLARITENAREVVEALERDDIPAARSRLQERLAAHRDHRQWLEAMGGAPGKSTVALVVETEAAADDSQLRILETATASSPLRAIPLEAARLQAAVTAHPVDDAIVPVAESALHDLSALRTRLRTDAPSLGLDAAAVTALEDQIAAAETTVRERVDQWGRLLPSRLRSAEYGRLVREYSAHPDCAVGYLYHLLVEQQRLLNEDDARLRAVHAITGDAALLGLVGTVGAALADNTSALMSLRAKVDGLDEVSAALLKPLSETEAREAHSVSYHLGEAFERDIRRACEEGRMEDELELLRVKMLRLRGQYQSPSAHRADLEHEAFFVQDRIHLLESVLLPMRGLAYVAAGGRAPELVPEAKGYFENIKAAIGALTTNVAKQSDLQAALVALRAIQDQLNTDRADTQSRLDGLDTRLADLQSTAARQETLLQVQTDVASLPRAVPSAADLRDLRDGVAALKGAALTPEERARLLAALLRVPSSAQLAAAMKVSRDQGREDVLARIVDAVTGTKLWDDLGELRAQLAAANVSDRLDALQSAVAGLGGASVDADALVKSAVATATDRIRDLVETDFKSARDELSAEVVALRATLDGTVKAGEEAREALGIVSAAVADLTARLPSGADLGRLSDRVREVSAALARVAGLETSLKELGAAVDRLESAPALKAAADLKSALDAVPGLRNDVETLARETRALLKGAAAPVDLGPVTKAVEDGLAALRARVDEWQKQLRPVVPESDVVSAVRTEVRSLLRAPVEGVTELLSAVRQMTARFDGTPETLGKVEAYLAALQKRPEPATPEDVETARASVEALGRQIESTNALLASFRSGLDALPAALALPVQGSVATMAQSVERLAAAVREVREAGDGATEAALRTVRDQYDAVAAGLQTLAGQLEAIRDRLQDAPVFTLPQVLSHLANAIVRTLIRGPPVLAGRETDLNQAVTGFLDVLRRLASLSEAQQKNFVDESAMSFLIQTYPGLTVDYLTKVNYQGGLLTIAPTFTSGVYVNSAGITQPVDREFIEHFLAAVIDESGILSSDDVIQFLDQMGQSVVKSNDEMLLMVRHIVKGVLVFIADKGHDWVRPESPTEEQLSRMLDKTSLDPEALRLVGSDARPAPPAGALDVFNHVTAGPLRQRRALQLMRARYGAGEPVFHQLLRLAREVSGAAPPVGFRARRSKPPSVSVDIVDATPLGDTELFGTAIRIHDIVDFVPSLEDLLGTVDILEVHRCLVVDLDTEERDSDRGLLDVPKHLHLEHASAVLVAFTTLNDQVFVAADGGVWLRAHPPQAARITDVRLKQDQLQGSIRPYKLLFYRPEPTS